MMETLYIIGTIIVGFGVVFKLLIDLGHKIEDGLIELDEKLALAIKAVVEKIPAFGDNEPINPIQMAIGQLIANMSQQNQQPAMKVIERDENGLYAEEGGPNCIKPHWRGQLWPREARPPREDRRILCIKMHEQGLGGCEEAGTARLE